MLQSCCKFYTDIGTVFGFPSRTFPSHVGTFLLFGMGWDKLAGTGVALGPLLGTRVPMGIFLGI